MTDPEDQARSARSGRGAFPRKAAWPRRHTVAGTEPAAPPFYHRAQNRVRKAGAPPFEAALMRSKASVGMPCASCAPCARLQHKWAGPGSGREQMVEHVIEKCRLIRRNASFKFRLVGKISARYGRWAGLGGCPG